MHEFDVDGRRALPGAAMTTQRRGTAVRRDRRRRRPQRPDRRRLPRARRPARVHARAPRRDRRRLRHRGAVAGPARVARVLRRLDAPAEGRRRPRAALASATTRSRSTRRSPRSPPTAARSCSRTTSRPRTRRSRASRRKDADAMPRFDALLARMADIPAADDAAPAARARLAPPGRRARAAARGRPRRRLQPARDPRAVPHPHHVGRRPARRLVRDRRAEGRLRVDRRGRRLGRPAHAGHRLQPAAPRARRARGRQRRVGPRARRHGRDHAGARGERARRRRGRSAPTPRCVSIDVRDGRVTGVTLASGEELHAPLVLSGAHPKTHGARPRRRASTCPTTWPRTCAATAPAAAR